MSFVPSEGIRPQPREDFRHPIVRGAPRPGANHRPGFIDETPPSSDPGAPESERAKTLVPPHNPHLVPRTALSARIRERLAREARQS